GRNDRHRGNSFSERKLFFATLLTATRRYCTMPKAILQKFSYKTYFVYVCIGVFSSSDAQAGLNFLVLPLSALVLTVPFWIIASIQEEQVSKYEGMEDETLPPLKSWNGFAMSGSPPKD
ncbi:MAG: hypothetical protein FWE95_06935, partial [Planctomycetaceae bacterium]|nr:hypothetical protein [Planctomycetaceae bacterium]